LIDLNQLFLYADHLNLVADDIDELRSNTVILVEACDEIGLQLRAEKTKYMITIRNTENEGNRYITVKNEITQNVNKFKFFGAYVTCKNDVTWEIKRRLASSNACFY